MGFVRENTSGKGKPKPSNPRKQVLDDEKILKRNAEQPKKHHDKKVMKGVQETDADEKSVVFARGMSEKTVKLELFLLEGNDRFEEKSLRSKRRRSLS